MCGPFQTLINGLMAHSTISVYLTPKPLYETTLKAVKSILPFKK